MRTETLLSEEDAGGRADPQPANEVEVKPQALGTASDHLERLRAGFRDGRGFNKVNWTRGAGAASENKSENILPFGTE